MGVLQGCMQNVYTFVRPPLPCISLSRVLEAQPGDLGLPVLYSLYSRGTECSSELAATHGFKVEA